MSTLDTMNVLDIMMVALASPLVVQARALHL